MAGILYLQIIACAVGLSLMASGLALLALPSAPGNYVLLAASLVGTVIGIVWAESIRKNIGIITFHSFLLSTPEIDGWRDYNIKRKIRERNI
ncbi:hypothetical protein G3R49_04405 [Shewanella sp. WXL01]|uniref:hypothetical protein n=1 Tax=Shewanella sp. WXL01 TaxID=2709721 RepID=UPI0014385EE1|nr:hypothetical protein [Shewanella sp. WXL01]NKF49812.1 hypothetical protein [Shewanella sp. WXL01]